MDILAMFSNVAVLPPVSLINTEGLIESVTTTLKSAVELFIESFTAAILDVLTLNFNTADNYLTMYFSFLDEIYYISQIIGFTLLFMIVVFSLAKGLTGGLAEVENPWILLIRALFFCGMIAIAASIMSMIYKPGSMLLDTTRALFDEAKTAVWSLRFAEVLGDNLLGFLGSVISRIVAALIILILDILIFVNYIKLALECLERWVVLAALYYTSPIAFSLGASRSTVQVFKAWVRMVLSSMVMLCLNMAFIYIYLVAVADTSKSVLGPHAFQPAGVSGFEGPLLYCWVLLAILKTGQKLDQYCGSLGMTTAQVGTMLGGEFLMAAAGVARTAGGIIKGAKRAKMEKAQQAERAAEKQAAFAERQATFNARQAERQADYAARQAERKADADAKQAEKQAMRNEQMKNKGFNPDGTQIVNNSGIKPTDAEIKNALQGKGMAFSGDGNAAAWAEKLGDVRNTEGENPFAGGHVLNTSQTETGVAKIDMENSDGSHSRHMLYTEKPEGIETTPITLADGSTMYMASFAAAKSGMPDISNEQDYSSYFGINDKSELYEKNSDSGKLEAATSACRSSFETSRATEPGMAASESYSVYNSNGVEYADSYLRRMSVEHGDIVPGSVRNDAAGNVHMSFTDGYRASLSNAQNTVITPGNEGNFTTVCDGSGNDSWYAYVKQPSIATKMGASPSQIQAEQFEMSDQMCANVASFLSSEKQTFTASNIDPRAVAQDNGDILVCRITNPEEGVHQYVSIAANDLYSPKPEVRQRAREAAADRGELPETGFVKRTSEDNGIYSVYFGTDAKEATAAFQPKAIAHNNELNAEAYRRMQSEMTQSHREYAENYFNTAGQSNPGVGKPDITYAEPKAFVSETLRYPRATLNTPTIEDFEIKDDNRKFRVGTGKSAGKGRIYREEDKKTVYNVHDNPSGEIPRDPVKKDGKKNNHVVKEREKNPRKEKVKK